MNAREDGCMERIQETLFTPVARRCDVLVAGGGIAGVLIARKH